MEMATKKMEGYDRAYTSIRQDGIYVPSGENDNLIVQRLNKNRDAMGIFGYSYLDNNRGKIQPVNIDGVEPTTKSISSGKYPVARDLFFYVKLDHLDQVPGLKEYVDLFLSRKMIGDRGYLKRQGLIPMPKKMRQQQRREWEERELLKKADLK
jgi:phosphate transport system substrate-binding protein